MLKVDKKTARKAYNKGQQVYIGHKEEDLEDRWKSQAGPISIFQGEYSADFDWRIQRFTNLTGKRPSYWLNTLQM